MKFIVLLIAGLVLTSCKTSQSPYYKDMVTYRDQTIKDYATNPRLDFSEEELRAISFFPIDEAYNCNCKFEKSEKPRGIEMATFSGEVKQFLVYGNVHCTVEGNPVTLELYQYLSPGIPKHYLFLPVKDETNGDITYGGGRYLELTTQDIQDELVVIDFNKLYNPYCAYKEGFSCPVPPPANHLKIPMPVGEKLYVKPE